MGIQPKLGGVVKIRFILAMDSNLVVHYCVTLQMILLRNHLKSLKIYPFLSKLKTYFYSTWEFGSDVQFFVI